MPDSQPPHSLLVDELDYHLPPGLIATRPAEPRDAARMLVMWRSNDKVEHRQVLDLPEYLQAGDSMVFNTTTVLPARFFGVRSTGGKVEGLFLDHQTNEGDCPHWRVMLKAGGRLAEGDRIELLDHQGGKSSIILKLLRKQESDWWVQATGVTDSHEALRRIGHTPLPPYIIKARGDESPGDDVDRRWYQTVYANAARAGSVAAPTAGLHFTEELLNQIARKGVQRIDVTLHVGPGTFKPVTAATLAEHPMHAESFEVTADNLEKLRERPSRVIAVGTTTVRTLESLPDPLPGRSRIVENYGGIRGSTDLLIAPPHQFRLVDGMLTNFHLPRSTLLALVAAMVGLDRLKAVYQQAIDRGYRFYSYGDAMLILP